MSVLVKFVPSNLQNFSWPKNCHLSCCFGMNNLYHFSTYINKFRAFPTETLSKFLPSPNSVTNHKLQVAESKLPTCKSNHLKKWQTALSHQHIECWSTGYHAQAAPQLGFPFSHGMFQSCLEEYWADDITLLHPAFNVEAFAPMN